MLKNSFKIVFILLFLSSGMLLSQTYKLETTGKKIIIESSQRFTANVINTLKISKNNDVIELGELRSGDEKVFSNETIAAEFHISGEKNKNINIYSRIYSESGEIKIEEIGIDYFTGSTWEPINTNLENDGNQFILNFQEPLNGNGELRLRIYPKRIKAGENLEHNYYRLMVEINCKYIDI